MIMNQNVLMSSLVALLGAIDPDSYAANTYTTEWIDASQFATFMAVVATGEMAATSTVNAKLQQAKDSSGTSAKDISSKAITELSGVGSPDDADKQAIVNLSQEELDMANDFDHFRLSVTVANDASDVCGLVFGSGARYGNANDNDLSSVDEIVS